jgi:hypothetical protein
MRFLNKVHRKLSVAARAAVYHGSPNKFSAFEGGGFQGRNFGYGHYFTEKREEAEYYADGGYVYTVDLNVHNPYNPRNEAHAKKLAKTLKLNWNAVKKDLSWKDTDSGWDKTDEDNFYIKISGVLIEKLLSENDSWTKSDTLIGEALKKAGFDSVYDPFKKWWVVPNPEHIKILKVEKV